MSNDIKNKIKRKGYWRVIIRPAKNFYNKNRFDIKQLVKPIEDSQIRLRGWYYPHVKKDDITISAQDKISNSCDFEGNIEYWEFTTSGQFGHIFSMVEDYIIDTKKADEIISNFAFNKSKSQDINKFFEVTSAVYEFTEIYFFAANLAQIKEYNDVEEFEIIIELIGVKERLLFNWDRWRHLWAPYICGIHSSKITFSEIYKKQELIAKFDSYALQKATDTFICFNWENPNVQVLREDQKKLLERRL